MFSFPPSNHCTLGSLKFHSSTLSHFFFHKKSSATEAQNFSGCDTLSPYACLYSSMLRIWKGYDINFVLLNLKCTTSLQFNSNDRCLSTSCLSGYFNTDYREKNSIT